MRYSLRIADTKILQNAVFTYTSISMTVMHFVNWWLQMSVKNN